MRLTHLNALRALEASLRHKSFTAAAEELGVTPAAVGQRVRSFEEYLGRPLLQRTRTGVVPTDEARRVEALLQSGISSLSSALEQLRHADRADQLSVTLPASFAEHWLAPSIWEFYRRHEDIDLRLDASNRDVDLLTEGFDFAIRYGRATSPPLKEMHLFEDAVLPVCSPDFLERHPINPNLRSLEGIPLIHVENRTSDPSWVGFGGWGAAFGFEPAGLRSGVRYSSFSSGLKSAIDGQGLVLSGVVEAFNAIRTGMLVAPFGPALRCKTEFSYRLIWVADRPRTKLGADFTQWVLEKADIFRRDLSVFLETT
ncbi:LysR substrate-binding domain-containing protein [Ruegeria profundi]|uniref:LysR substrate-binding domain-containing protein n=1 Tax=Ruegeria profundi TaxID=1685378 RepID=UPI001CD6E6B4|nr:LysR substrate-binding domain-containing protein [Ruegeria profundi]MCA0930757.1 LysR family transcriptional regulator [Ruegeria profundi]